MERALEWSSIAAKNKRTAYVRVAGMLVAAQVVRRFGEGRSQGRYPKKSLHEVYSLLQINKHDPI